MTHSKTATKDFSFKQFTIHGGFSGMPVSTDGVLLGAWIESNKNDYILDIGSGTGLLSLMCAQRFVRANITAIEIDLDAYKAAQHNFQVSPWLERLSLIHCDILNWNSHSLFDTIICNPPYFNNGEQAHSQTRATARHTCSLSHHDLLIVSKQLIKPDGKANFILPYIEGTEFISMAEKSGWTLSRLCTVAPTPTKPISRLLIELRTQQHKTETSNLVINQSTNYSAEFIALTKDFYLKM